MTGSLIIPQQYLAQPAHHILQELRNLAIRHNISIAGTIVEPDHVSAQPDTSPFTSSPSDRSAWAKYIRQTLPETFGHSYSASHADRASESKDLPAEDEQSGITQKLLNVAYFIEGGTGEIIGKYIKRNLWISERYVAFPDRLTT